MVDFQKLFCKDDKAEPTGDNLIVRLWKRVSGSVKTVLSRISDYFDNLKLRTKMIILCVVCVLVPVIATNCIFWTMINRAEQERIVSQMEDVRANTENQLDSLRQSLSTMTATFYTNTGLYKFLNTSYESDLEYFEAYRTYIEPFSVVYGNNTFISNINIYADNETLINGGGVSRLSAVKDTEWYKYFNETGGTSAIYSYYDDSRTMRTISLIRILDYSKHSLGGMERILKLDLSYGFCSHALSQEQAVADIYICDDSNILFSNTDPSSGVRPFVSVSEIDPSQAVRNVEYNMLGTPLRVMLFYSDELDGQSVGSVLEAQWPLILMMVLINLLLPFAVVFILNRSITTRVKELARHLNMVKEEQFEEIDMPQAKDELGDLTRDYNHMTRRMRELIEDVYKERLQRQDNELQRQQAELQALHSQINPHFMFNALESIRMRSMLRGENETAEIIELLAVMMRKSTDWGNDLVTVSSEASFAETYLKLQRFRFGSRLSYRIDIAPDCSELLVPKLSIVTFVENACVHGVEGVKRDCFVIITVEKDDSTVRIYVEDTGAGMSEKQQEAILHDMRSASFDDLQTSHSVGIINACLRLKKHFGEDVAFELDSEEGAGLCITITIPADRIIRLSEEKGKYHA